MYTYKDIDKISDANFEIIPGDKFQYNYYNNEIVFKIYGGIFIGKFIGISCDIDKFKIINFNEIVSKCNCKFGIKVIFSKTDDRDLRNLIVTLYKILN